MIMPQNNSHQVGQGDKAPVPLTHPCPLVPQVQGCYCLYKIVLPGIGRTIFLFILNNQVKNVIINKCLELMFMNSIMRSEKIDPAYSD